MGWVARAIEDGKFSPSGSPRAISSVVPAQAHYVHSATLGWATSARTMLFRRLRQKLRGKVSPRGADPVPPLALVGGDDDNDDARRSPNYDPTKYDTAREVDRMQRIVNASRSPPTSPGGSDVRSDVASGPCTSSRSGGTDGVASARAPESVSARAQLESRPSPSLATRGVLSLADSLSSTSSAPSATTPSTGGTSSQTSVMSVHDKHGYLIDIKVMPRRRVVSQPPGGNRVYPSSGGAS
jgi:hypothetical protein